MSPKSRIQYGVDHESYAYQLAIDMESAPSFFQVLARGWKMTLVWALGANFNAKFRLVGPWAWYGAWEVLEGECWETITRRGGFFGEFASVGIKECKADRSDRSCDAFWIANAGVWKY